MDTHLQVSLSPDSIRARRSSAQRLAAAGAIAAEMLGAGQAGGAEPSSKEIADAILHWLKTGERGQ
jgi:hypothetical protein